ncbi:hypothetical protein [Actinomadura sp. 6N118]|uniref:hypothetical protein n=1 Tax=Actinomadura sp. 6N118 TaxID=3375151 RepID=UPI0037B0CD72
MARAKRAANGRSTIYQSKDGKWHGRVSMGLKDDGTPYRPHIERWDKNEVVREVQRLEKLRDEGNAPKAGKRMKVEAWLTYWINEVAIVPTVRRTTHDGYRVDVVHHLIPGIGNHWLDKLTFTHLERLYTKMQQSGLKPATAHHVHRTIRVALGEAHRREIITKNVAKDAKAPVIDEEEVEPYDVDEIKDLLEVAALRRNSARWIFALAFGLRQGEALGLKWEDFDLDKGILRIRRQAIRAKYAHGCGNVCGRKPGYCRQKIRTNPLTADVKSRAGRRRIGLPPFVIALLRRHKEAQDAEGEDVNEAALIAPCEDRNALYRRDDVTGQHRPSAAGEDRNDAMVRWAAGQRHSSTGPPGPTSSGWFGAGRRSARQHRPLEAVPTGQSRFCARRWQFHRCTLVDSCAHLDTCGHVDTDPPRRLWRPASPTDGRWRVCPRCARASRYSEGLGGRSRDAGSRIPV